MRYFSVTYVWVHVQLLPLVILFIYHLNNYNGEFNLFYLTKRGAFQFKSTSI